MNKRDPHPAVAPFPFRYYDSEPPSLPLGPSLTDVNLEDTHILLTLWSPQTPELSVIYTEDTNH